MNSTVENPNENVESKKQEVCMNCIKLMQENSQLKEQIAILSGEGKKKQYTIAPTLYTFYKNNVQKNRISRLILLYILICRAASQVTSNLLECEEEDEVNEYNEEIIAQCSRGVPNNYFISADFLESFENQCNQVSKIFFIQLNFRIYIQFRTALAKVKIPSVCVW